MKVQSQSSQPVVAQRAGNATAPAQKPAESDQPAPPSFEDFYAPQRRKELLIAAVPVWGAYHNIDRAATNLLGFGTGGGYRVGAALCNIAGTAGLVLGHIPLGVAGLVASSGLTYMHQHRG